jgi:alpha-tubulin suppressor-like RCC1 family protein
MRPSLRRPLAAATVALLALPALALATVRPEPLRIRWLGDAPAEARPGVVTTGRFEVVAGKPGTLEDVRVEGRGWAVEPFTAARAAVAKGERRVFDFRALPANEREPLRISATLDGRRVTRELRLDAASLAKARGATPVAFVDGAPRLSPPGERAQGGQVIRFRGRFVYVRNGGPTLGADHLVVRVMDDDSPDPFDEVIWEGHTDEDGSFDVVVNWDDGLDDPDIYVVFSAGGGEVDVQTSDILEITYDWSSEDQVIDDYTGNFVDFGTMQSGDPGEHGAVAVYTNTVRAHRYAALHGMNAPLVDVQWPDDATYYNPFFEEVHIEGDETWNEGTQAHEFGHHLHENFGNLLSSDYDNGFCDTPDPGHCVWCPENLSDAWQEGWANWFGSWVVRAQTARYGTVPTSLNDGRYTLEDLARCQQDSVAYPGGITEGYIGALLRDMDDAQNDDHDAGPVDCDMDAMTAGDAGIMTVFRDDDPTDIFMFLNSFRSRYPEHDQDLWSTTRNVWVGFGFPILPPLVTSSASGRCQIARAGETVVLDVQGNGSLLQYQWRRNGENLADGGGVSGALTKHLVLSPASGGMTGRYNCLVSTCDGTFSTLSLPFEVTIVGAPLTKGLVSWGSNESGQVGNGTNVWRVAPAVHENLPDVVRAVGGGSFSAALRANGAVYTWGYAAGYGELGNGNYFDQTFEPAALPGLAGVLQLASGDNWTLALKRDGTVWGWGYNGYGNLADSTQSPRPSPVLARALAGCVKAVACGAQFGLALMADGTVQAWGDNSMGTLGRGAAGGWSPVPQAVQGLADVEAISACGYLALALKTDGTVWAWGTNQSGALGIGVDASVTPHSAVPVQVTGLPVIRKIAAGANAGFAISNDGAAYSWGSNQYGLLGTGGPLPAFRPTAALVPGLTLPVQIVAGWGGFAGALQSDGTVWIWGYNNRWPLGRDHTTESIWTPLQVSGVSGVTALGNGWSTVHATGDLAGVTGAQDPPLPVSLSLEAAPNPSFGRAALTFALPREARVTLAVYDVGGRRVRTLVDESRPAGTHVATWDGRGDGGTASLAGVYFVRLDADGEQRTQRIVRIR